MGARYKRKKDLIASIGKPLKYIETNVVGEEYKPNGTLYVVGPCPITDRKWFAEVRMVNGLIKAVR